jgi:hypothetical protein
MDRGGGTYWEQWRPFTEKRGGREPTRAYLLRPCLARLAAAQPPRGILQRRHGSGRRGSSLWRIGDSDRFSGFPGEVYIADLPRMRGGQATARAFSFRDRRWSGGRQTERGVKGNAGLGPVKFEMLRPIGPCFFSLRFTRSIRNPFSFLSQKKYSKKWTEIGDQNKTRV